MKYLIIGNGAAGIAAAEKIRKLDGQGEITILTSEKYPVYSKCLLADFLSGDIPMERMFIRDEDFYEKKNLQICYNRKVTNIDFDLKQVYAGYVGSESPAVWVYNYDKLLIATGSSHILPPIKGLDASNTYFLSSLDEARKIAEDAKNARRIIIIGGGFVGLEAAFNLYKTGKEVTIVERLPRILMGLLDERASRIISNFVEQEGIRLIVNSSVSMVLTNFSSLLTGNSSKSVILDDGRRLKADMIISAAGTKPNLDFIKDPRMKINRGIVADKYMQTSIKDVYAAGDIVESIDAVTGRMSLSPIWPNAVIQGETAGSSMAGKERPLDSQISMQNASEFREIPMISMGITNPPEGGDCEEYIDYRPIENIYRKLVIKDNIIIGMIFLGDIRNSGVIGALIKNKTNIRRLKSNLLNSNFGYSEVADLI